VSSVRGWYFKKFGKKKSHGWWVHLPWGAPRHCCVLRPPMLAVHYNAVAGMLPASDRLQPRLDRYHAEYRECGYSSCMLQPRLTTAPPHGRHGNSTQGSRLEASTRRVAVPPGMLFRVVCYGALSAPLLLHTTFNCVQRSIPALGCRAQGATQTLTCTCTGYSPPSARATASAGQGNAAAPSPRSQRRSSATR
jgi:hypothetical protein